MHAARLQTIAQLRQLRGRARELEPESFELLAVRRAETALLTCSAHLVFEVNELHDFARLKSGRFCRIDKLCSCCARLRAARLVREYGARCGEIFKLARGRLKPVHVVLTVRNGAELSERFNMLRVSWSRFLQQRRDHAKGKHHQLSVFIKSSGGVGSVEIKRGSGSGLWHPHMHAVLLVPVELNASDLREELKREWEMVTRGDSFNVHVGEVHAIERGELTEEAMRGAFTEVFKYATKGGQMTPADSYEAWHMLRGRKLIQPFGWLKGGDDEPRELCDVRELIDFDLVERVYVETPGGYVLQEARSE
jgi:hypothetical protein